MKPRPVCHPFVSEMITEEIEARKWSEPVIVISELAKVSRQNVATLLTFEHRLTGIECWIIDQAFGLSEGFMSRFQTNCETRCPQ